jgi:hypothetical protein
MESPSDERIARIQAFRSSQAGARSDVSDVTARRTEVTRERSSSVAG